MDNVRPLSVQEIISAVRHRHVPTRRGMFVSELYYITESECRALLSAFSRLKRSLPSTKGNAK